MRTAMEPLSVLIVLPLVVGAVAERLFRDTSRASLAAAVVSSLPVNATLAEVEVVEPLGALVIVVVGAVV